MQTLEEIVVEGAERFGDRVAFHLAAGNIDFRTLKSRVSALVSQFRQLGLDRHDRVAVVMPNGPEMAVLCYAACLGAICAPLNADYRVDEFEFHLGLLDANLLVTVEAAPAPALEAAASLGLTVLTLSGTLAEGSLELSAPAGPIRAMASARSSPRPEDTALLLYTSGTTARPKLVPLTHRAICATARNLRSAAALTPEDRCLSLMPMFHVGGLVDLLFSPLAAGGSVAFVPVFSAPHLQAELQRHRPTWTQMVPTMVQPILDEASSPASGFALPPQLRLIRVVAAALPEKLARAWLERFPTLPLTEVYGMTETATLIASNPLPPALGKPGSVGRAAGPQVRVVDDAGHPLPAGESGEIVVAGDNVMSGYLGVDNSATFYGRWFRTGDWGYLDREGDLFITGRIKEIINRAGEKVSPAEIDQVLVEHPDIAEAATFGVPDSTLGEAIAAAVVASPGTQPNSEDIIRFAERRLARFKVPRQIFLVETLPRTQNGKLRRGALAQELNITEGSAPDQPPDDLQANQAVASPGHPQQPLQERLRALWCDVLECESIADDDDFFDLGGDSLRAMTFITQLCEGTASNVFPVALYDAPTINRFGAFLESAHPDLCRTLITDPGDESANAVETATTRPEQPVQLRDFGEHRGLTAEDCAFMLAHLEAWPIPPVRAGSLIVKAQQGRDAVTPLFWCAPGLNVIRALAAELGADRSVYAMRTGHSIFEQAPHKIEQLATTYAAQIRNIQPEGPYLLGGFCQGGRIAFRIARLLREAGLEVGMLLLHEKIVVDAIDVPVTLLFADDSEDNPLNHTPRSTLDFEVIYPHYSGLETFPGNHRNWFEPPNVGHFGALVKGVIEGIGQSVGVQHGTVQPVPIDGTPSKFRVEIRAPQRLLFRPGKPVRFKVHVTNRSGFSWNQGADHALSLGCFLIRSGDTAISFTSLTRITALIRDNESAGFDLSLVPPGGQECYRMKLVVVAGSPPRLAERPDQDRNTLLCKIGIYRIAASAWALIRRLIPT